jgi:YHS domain-containing protein
MEEIMRRIVIPAALVLAIAVAAPLAEKTETAALDGYCPVAYVAAGKAMKGDPNLSFDYGGAHYVFANADAKKMFEENPDKFHVAYDGYCATAASMGKKLESDPTIFTVHEGVAYRFSSEKAQGMFEADVAGVIAKANKEWALLSPAYDGHCPVAYVMMEKAVPGNPDIALQYHGSLIYFANADAKKMFEAEPGKFSVAYHGYCATAASMGKWYESDSSIFIIEDGVTYLFSSDMAKEMFEANPAKVVGKADEQWAAAHSH